LRDGTRTLMKAVKLIRREGLKARMEPPEQFLRRINRLCIEMTHSRRQRQSQKERKRILRGMKKLVKVVGRHARRHRELLDKNWKKTAWTRPQAEQVLRRIDQVLALLPRAAQQAHERMIGGRQVDNAEKILSLYEPDIHVLVRGKAGAEVEFGNTLLLAENPQGLIIDWELFREKAPADVKLLLHSVERMEQVFGPLLKALGADRGFDSQANQAALAKEHIYNGVCPRSPQQLQQRNASWKFKKLQRRRAQTEGRVSIIKNVFLGGRVRSKGFAHRELTVTWTVLVHNLWVLARMQLRAEAVQAKRQAA